MISALLLAAAVSAAAPNQCLLCHPDVRVLFDRSRHHAEEVTCTACHGGNAQAITVEGAHGGNFRGVPKRRDIPALCATCHSNVEKMRPYNLPTDQFALYQTSRHGQLLMKGDDRVAVCTDCHGSHEILPPEDPRSSTYVRNIPATCGKCHGVKFVMEPSGYDTSPFFNYQESVHGRAVASGSQTAAVCTDCHNAHDVRSGKDPKSTIFKFNVPATCNKCHAEQSAQFVASVHGQALERGNWQAPVCTDCHGIHLIKDHVDPASSVSSQRPWHRC